MRLEAIKFPTCMRKIIVTMRKIATNTFLDTGCLPLIVYCFLFEQKSKYLNKSGWGRASKIFRLGALPPAAPGFLAAAPRLSR